MPNIPQVLRISCRVSILAALIPSVGCDGSGANAQSRKNRQRSPEQAFEYVMKRLKRQLEHRHPQPLFAVSPETGELESQFTVQEEVNGEILPPADEEGQYTARVIVRSSATFTHQRQDPALADPSSSADQDDKPSILDDDTGDSIFDFPLNTDGPILNTTPGDDPSENATESTAFTPPKLAIDPYNSIKEYKLVFKDGQWALTSQPEKESMQLIFEYALTGQ